MNQELIREDQRRFGRQLTLSGERPASSAVRTTIKARKPGMPKGHEAFLKALESSNATVVFEKISSGEVIVGTIKTSDKFTISVVQEDTGRTRVLFKHDISEFSPVERKSPADEAAATVQ